MSLPVHPEGPTPTFDAEVLDGETADVDEPTVDEDGERVVDSNASPDVVDKARADHLAAGIYDDENAG